MEKKMVKKKVNFLTWVLGLIFFILVVRLAYLQLIETQRYQGLAQDNLLRIIPITAPRGEIIDCNGEVLVDNKPVYALSLSFFGVGKDKQQQVEELIADILARDENVGMDASQWLETIREKLDQQTRPFEPIRVAVGITWETVVRVKERQTELPGVIVEEEPVRNYPNGKLLAHVLGYVREIKQEQLEENKNKDYRMGDLYGQSGLENTFESYLRGTKGARQIEVDASGRPVDTRGVKKPVPGCSLALTIDLRLQEAAEKALANGIEGARKRGYQEANAGAVVVMNARTGAVLAMASYPTYDPSIFVDVLSYEDWEKLQKEKALSNRALGTYAPGSIFKMVTATAILQNKIVDPDYQIFDPGYFYHGRRYNDWQPQGHGQVDLRKAIQVSCNTYFFTYGLAVGNEEIARYAKEYGLGEKTGIELPGESGGLVPTPEYKQKVYPEGHWDYEWRDYDTLNMSIGQGYNRYSTLQLASYITAIANGGTLYKPYLVEKIINPDGSVRKLFLPEVRRKVNVSPENLKIIQEGMRMVTEPGGTAYWQFRDFPMEVAAKTGSAEVEGHDSHSQFVAYAPFDNPEIVVAATVEYGGHGSDAAGPVVREIMDAYYKITRGGGEEDKEPSSGQNNEPSGSVQPAGNAPVSSPDEDSGNQLPQTGNASQSDSPNDAQNDAQSNSPNDVQNDSQSDSPSNAQNEPEQVNSPPAGENDRSGQVPSPESPDNLPPPQENGEQPVQVPAGDGQDSAPENAVTPTSPADG